MTDNAKKAIKIGAVCFFAYLAVYLARNVLGVVTPAMQTQGFTKDDIGIASSIFFYTYAVGQLVNGAIGDKIKAKYMMGFGLALAGISNILFERFISWNESFAQIPALAYVAYGATGFFLSMVYGPMTKVVSENTEMPYTTRCSLGYTFAAYFGSPAAGILATIFVWQKVFTVSSVMLIAMAAALMISFTVFERRGIIVYNRFDKDKTERTEGRIKQLFSRQIVKFSIVSILTGIVRTSVIFWLPTYFIERLELSYDSATITFTVASLVISFASFIVIFIYEKIGHNLDKTLLLMFVSSAIFFFATYFVKIPYVNVVLIVLAIMASNGAATMLWSRYCPSLRDTEIVSGVTGFLDFLSYVAAATANIVFPYLIEQRAWPWESVLLIWLSLMLVGIAISLPWKKWSERKSPSKE